VRCGKTLQRFRSGLSPSVPSLSIPMASAQFPADKPISDVKLHDPGEVAEPIYRESSFPNETYSETPLLPVNKRPFKFVTTWRFWIILILGQILSWCIVSTNTLTEYLSLAGANIPAFQTLFNYVLLNLVYTSWTLYKYGFKKWAQLVWKDGWKFFVLAFADVQGVCYSDGYLSDRRITLL
jgi:solute carrier family 35, member F1/2